MKLRIAAITLIAMSSTAMAADLPAKAPAYVAPAPVYNWTGFYIGGHIGGAFTGSNTVDTNIGTLVRDNNNSAFLGGGQVGADYQFSSNWLIGVEGQISGTSNNERHFSDPVGISGRDRSNWLASVTGRLGYTWGPGLLYFKGGVAFRDNSDLSVVGLPGGTTIALDRNDTGYTVGGGLEYMFAPAWSAKIEYQYYNFDRTSIAFNGGPLGGDFISFRDDLHTVKAGINYHFNWGGSQVVAKY